VFPCSIHIGALVPRRGTAAGVPGPRRNADDRDAGWFAPVATRRRPMLGPFSRGLRLGSQCFSGGDDPSQPPAWHPAYGGFCRTPGPVGRLVLWVLVLSDAWFWVALGPWAVCTCIWGGEGMGWSGYVAVSSQRWVGWPSWAGCGSGSAWERMVGPLLPGGGGAALGVSLGLWVCSGCIMYAAVAGGNEGAL
jgi:hypothetical protein